MLPYTGGRLLVPSALPFPGALPSWSEMDAGAQATMSNSEQQESGHIPKPDPPLTLTSHGPEHRRKPRLIAPELAKT